jgi:DNA topoisomerase IA
MSPKETMSLCQQLYQDGHITYMRTDSQRISSVFLSSARKFIGDTWNPSYVVGDMSHIESTDKGGAHEAIRPTDISRTVIESKVARMGSLYNLIWKTTVESCMVDAKVNVATIEVSCPLEKAKYVSHIETIAFPGWKIVAGKLDTMKDQQSEALKMSLRNRAPKVAYNVIRSESVMRNKGSHYTEAGLIKKLEDLGIGRPSTYASIIDTIKERGYATLGNIEGQMHEVEDFVLNRDIRPRVEIVKSKKLFGQEKNKLTIQPIGELVVEFLMQHYRTLFEYEYTSSMEVRLDKIAEGVDTTTAICGDCCRAIDELENATKECEKVAIPLDSDHVVVFEKYGAVIRSKEKVDGEYVFTPINKTFDLEKLRRGEYQLSDLQVSRGGHIENIQRVITPDLSIRLGKFGYYLYYKRKNMKSPEFYNLKKCKIAYLKCEDSVLIGWIKDNYPNII